MRSATGTTGLVFNEPLLWEMGAEGRMGFSMPPGDVPHAPVDDQLTGDGPDFPDLCEPDIIRHYTRLSQWNIGVDSSMYPLGSCTMKYNPRTNERQAALPGIAQAHPLLPSDHCQGLLGLIYKLERLLAEITGLDAVTLQPAAGSQGELTGMLIMNAFHADQGSPRSKLLIPDTAHAAHPASATLCGFQAVPAPSNTQGILDPQAVSDRMDEQTAGILVTNPNMLGLFEDNIRAVADAVHAKGGLVYCDGTNFNAMMGIVNMAACGVDLLHLNLHHTFSTPHGGGGPGVGPVCVTRALEPYLPVPRVVKESNRYEWNENFSRSVGKLHAFYGNFGVLVRAYSYILSLGHDLVRVSQYAVLNATYIKDGLKDHFHMPYDRPCMHACVFSDKLQQSQNISALDMAKRLMDYGYHPPAIYFPLAVRGVLMIEPTESESKETLDEFIAAMRRIAREAQENPKILQQAPHCTKSRRLDETRAARELCLDG